MAMISVKCPSCGETFQADNEREFAFCSYCGGKVELSQIKEVSPEDEAEKNELSDESPERAVSANKTMSREEFERKKAFERRCSEQIAFCNDQLSKTDKKIVNSRNFFNKHLTQWQEAQYRVSKELQRAETHE